MINFLLALLFVTMHEPKTLKKEPFPAAF